MNKKLVPMLVVLSLILLFSWTMAPQNASAGTSSVPGLPFTEDFADTALRDADETNANWSTEEQALILNWRHAQYGGSDAGVTGSDISSDAHGTSSIALVDVDADGDLDLVVGNLDETNRLYLNDGTATPFSSVTGSDISSDAHATSSIALVDVDADGDLDLVAGNQNQTNRLYLNNGTAAPFSGVSGSNISSDTHDTWSIALADVDADGDLDLVVGNDSQTNRLYLNNGTASPFSGVSGSNISSEAHDTRSIALADVDADGDLDLVAGNYAQTNRLYLNDGTASPFSGVSGSDISSDTYNTYSIALADVDGDGHLDMVAGNDILQTNRLYMNNGTADPFNGVAGSDISSDANDTISVALADLDGDGDVDMLAGNYAQTNRLYLNNGTADPFSALSGSDISSDTNDTSSIALADMDGDGQLDMVAGNYSASVPNRLYLNNGTSNPFNGVSGSNISSDTNSTYSIVFADVDGDGQLDLVAGNYNHTNRLYLNNGSSDPFNGVSGSDISSDAHDTRSIAVADVDGDGHLDIVAGNFNHTNRLYLNNGTSNPFNGVSGSDISADAHNTSSIALADVDGDGHLDMVAGNYNHANCLYLNNGTLNPFNGVTGSDISSDAHKTRSIALADMDGDGHLDLVAGNLDQTNRIYLNNGTLNPFNGVTGSDISSDAHKTRSIALADVDGDGDLDLLGGNSSSIVPNRLYLNNGTASPFSTVTGSNISSDAHQTYSIALGDVDGDGDLDMVAGNTGQTNRIYLNNGSSNPFSAVTGADISSDTHDTNSIALADVDGDGDVDLVAGNYGQINRLYVNRRAPSPFNGVSGSNISSDADHTASIALGDVDGDGDVDLVAGNINQTHRLYLNNGSSNPFSGVSGSDISSGTLITHAIALADVDADGDLDLVAGNYGQFNVLYLNNGSADPFNPVTVSSISSDMHSTRSIALADMDGDGDLDIVAGNNGINRLYLNNGTADPFNGVAGSNISSDAHNTFSIALADVDGDGDVDMVAGNDDQTSRLYRNNGTASPFSAVTGSDISSDAHATSSVVLADVDMDGDLDLVVGNYDQTNRLYLNDGSATPFKVVTGSDVSSDAHSTLSIALADVDGDGDLDLAEGNVYQTNSLYLNNGTADPFNGVSGVDISSDTNDTFSIGLADMDRDGDLDFVAGNYAQANRLYLQRKNYNTAHGLAASLRIDTESSNISGAKLTASADLPNNTGVTYYLSNNGGARWYIVQSGVRFTFPTTGMDLRWKAELESLSPILTPKINQIQIDIKERIYMPLIVR